MFRKFNIALNLAVIVSLLITSLALADNTVPDGDGVIPVSDQDLYFGTVCVNSINPDTVLVAISRQGNYGNSNVFKISTNATVTVLSSTGSGLSASMDASPATIAIPANWNVAANTTLTDYVSSTLTFAAGSSPGSFTGTVTYRSSGTKSDGTFMDRDTTIDVYATVSNTGDCAPAPSDTTAPTANTTQDPPANLAGWNKSAVTVDWNWADEEDGSGIDTDNCTTSSTSSGEGTITLNATCKDLAGNTGSASYTVKVDMTKPTSSANASPTPNGNGWNNSDVTVSFSGSDTLSGIESCSEPVVLSSEGAGKSASGTCTDNAGNVSALATASGINIDLTPPSFGACPAGGPFILKSGLQSVGPISVNADISGLDSVLSILSGSVDTSTIGLKNVLFTAFDNASNSVSKSCYYSVIFKWDGFRQSVDMGIWNKAKAGSAIPIKFSLFGDQGLSIFLTGFPKSTPIPCDAGAYADPIETTVTAGGSSLSYDSSADQYIYVWKTDKGWAGTCRQFSITLIDGTIKYANFQFTK